MKIVLLAASLLCAVPALAADAPASQSRAVPGFSAARAEQLVGAPSRAVVRALQTNDTRALAPYLHPTRGARFSPYVYVQPSHRVITREQMRHLAHHPRRWTWGEADGTGDPIYLTWDEFRRKFLVPRPYLPGAQESFNRLTSQGNLINNMAQTYPGAIIARYYLPGENPNYGGLDWRALFLAWRPVGSKWYLVGVAGDQWTT